MDNDIRSPEGARWKKRYLLLGGMALGAAFGARIIANKWPRNGKSSNGNGSNGAVEVPEMVALYSKGAALPVLPGKDQAQSNGSTVAADPVLPGVVTPNGGSSTATAEERVGISVEDAPSAGPHAAAHGASSRFNFKTFESLKYRDYRLLWFSIVFSAAGMWMEQIALSWMIYEMTDSKLLLGALNAVRAVPFLLVGPIAGV
ncbi:MAG: transporter, partial [Dehalococcoidia bacterium]|nr:transporter [Dehalococcoidia bacterium]